MPTSYLDFDLRIERSGERYRTRVEGSPAGEASAEFDAPFSPLEVENFNLRVTNSIGSLREGVRRLESAEREAARDFGGRLFDAALSGDVLATLRASLNEVQRRGAGLRLRLRLAEVPELAGLPWECLYYPAMNRFLALSPETPLVRYLDLPEGTRGLDVRPPLRILTMISAPSDYPGLDVDQEWAKLSEATAGLSEQGLVELHRLEQATLPALQRKIRTGDFHVFHFIGHGGFVPRADDGALVLEDDQGRGRLVSGQDLGVILHGYRPLRLALLNACEGARGSTTDPFAGAAQSLVQQGIPAVIAMQFPITDRAAILFAQEFYGAATGGLPVDAALTEARRSLFAADHVLEWAVPVLYMRSPNGRLFRMTTTRAAPKSSPEPEPVVETAAPPVTDLEPAAPAEPAVEPVPEPVPVSQPPESPPVGEQEPSTVLPVAATDSRDPRMVWGLSSGRGLGVAADRLSGDPVQRRRHQRQPGRAIIVVLDTGHRWDRHRRLRSRPGAWRQWSPARAPAGDGDVRHAVLSVIRAQRLDRAHDPLHLQSLVRHLCRRRRWSRRARRRRLLLEVRCAI